MKIFFVFAIFLLSSFFAFSQEVIVPLQRIKSDQIRKSKKNFGEAVKIPFVEDFSAYYGYPDSKKFIDNYVNIGDGYATNPLSIGVATFDGLDSDGNFYSHGNSFQFAADSLTSVAIRLDSIFSGLPHKSSLADSIYFSFFFQPQGLGEKPDAEDSLTLWFFAANQNKWYNVWSSKGMSLNQFRSIYNADWKCVMIPILDTMFLNNGFQFRFVNYASYADLSLSTWDSNCDFWNIDYIILNNDRHQSDSLPEDLAFKQRQTSLLKNYYSMPWNQFLANSSAEMAAEINIPYINYSSYLINSTEKLIINNLSGGPSYNSELSAANLQAQTETSFFRNPIPYTFNSTTTENAEFLIKMCINTATINDLVRTNDTVSFYQRFYNYYSTDDGSAEAGYGLSVKDAELAYAFKTNTPDTLQAIQMMFNKTFSNSNEIFFYLTIWNDNNGKPGNVIYEKYVLPIFTNENNSFGNYILDNPIAVNGTFYVGWKQSTEDVLNLGFDMNSDRSEKIFYNTDGNWYNSLYKGALMIRPILGQKKQAYVRTENHEIEKLSVFPNPCYRNDIVYIKGLSTIPTTITIYDINGKEVDKFFNQDYIYTNSLQAGFYFINVGNDNNSVFKLLVTP